jgi:5-formyltetrahydrofolate cyclo-ligase
MSKIAYRQHFRKLRSSISAELSVSWSQKITHDLLRILHARGFEGTLFLFKPLPGEPDLLSFLPMTRFHIALPRILPSYDLAFHAWFSGDPLIKSHRGLWEPSALVTELRPQSGDIVVVPSIAIDSRGHRLGFGGGYYDRWLALHRPRLELAVGVVFPPCYFEGLFLSEPHDIPMDLCLTGEQTVKFCNTEFQI